MARFQAGALVLIAAVMWAQGKNRSAPSTPSPSAHAKSSLPDLGAIRDGVYRNSAFGFSYKLPFGWVDRTTEMQEDRPGDSSGAAKSLLLLAIFERPPEASGNVLNSAVVVAAEHLSSYSGMKTATDYFGPLTELATAKGFQAAGEPHAFVIGATELVRGDFTKPRGTATVRQTSLVLMEKGYEVSFTFIGGTEDEISELIEKLSFGTRNPQR